MWSFLSKDLDVIYKRAQEQGADIIARPGSIESSFMPDTRTLLLNDPSGFPIEIYESAGD